VKLDEDSGGLLFAHGSDCTDWIPIPLDAIETVELLDVVPCRDHAHPLVTLSIKAPESPEGALYASMLKGSRHGIVSRVVRRPQSFGGIPIGTRLARLSDGWADVILGPETPAPGGCAANCNQYEVDGAGNIYQLVGCKDYGPGIYVCYYQ
jgi:hypothetical protein